MVFHILDADARQFRSPQRRIEEEAEQSCAAGCRPRRWCRRTSSDWHRTEYEQHLEPNGRHGEEVDGHRGFHVILQEAPLCVRRRIPTANHVFAHARFAHVDAEFEEFTVDAGRAPNRVVAAHLANQFTDFLRHRWAAELAASDLPSPEQSESLAVPSDDGCRFDDAQSRAPFGLGSTKPSPQEPVEPVQFRLLDRTLQREVGGEESGSQAATPLECGRQTAWRREAPITRRSNGN
jgi:hypothetical protein